MKMKKMMLLMLTLLILGAASMNAQVRIGGTGDPYGAAALDVNANNDSLPTGNLGLALPRVDLTAVDQSLGGNKPKNGTLVYNNGNQLNGPGVYVWAGTQWILIGSQPEIPVTGVGYNLNGSPNFVSVGESYPLNAYVIPDDATNKTILYNIDSQSGEAELNLLNRTITYRKQGTVRLYYSTPDGLGNRMSVTILPVPAKPGMYFKTSSSYNCQTNEETVYYRLVESYRDAAGQPRQRTILSLGKEVDNNLRKSFVQHIPLFSGCHPH